MAKAHSFKPLKFEHRTDASVVEHSKLFNSMMKKRRTVRDFSARTVPESVIGANMQPWHFVAVSNAEIKQKIRVAAEIEERELYEHRASDEWLKALEPMGTNAEKPFLEKAPWLIAIFAQKYTLNEDGTKHKHYYTPESVGIATGFLIAALHHAGLATLTHTPSPMSFLRDILERPDYEKPFLLLVTGYPADNAMVPDIEKRPMEKLISWRN